MSARDCIDKCKAKPVAVRLSSFHSALKQMRHDFRRKPRSIVFKNQRHCLIFHLQSNRHRAGCVEVLQFVVKEIAIMRWIRASSASIFSEPTLRSLIFRPFSAMLGS